MDEILDFQGVLAYDKRSYVHYFVCINIGCTMCVQEVYMAKVKVDFSRCKGCFLCSKFCPKNVLVPSKELGAKGFPIVSLDESKECIGCGACYKMCPDYCIEIEE